MDDEIDLKKMMDVLNNTKEEMDNLDYDDFIVSDEDGSDTENNLDEKVIPIEEESLSDNDTFDASKIYKHFPIKSLSAEEQSLIDSCEDPELKELLSLNRSKNISLICFYKHLQDLLMECKQYILEKTALIKDHTNILKVNHQSSGCWRLAAPYFKDKQLYQSPLNEDTIKKKENNELSVYDLSHSPNWSNNECQRVIKAVKLNYNFNKHKSLFENGSKTKALDQSLAQRFEDMIQNETLEIPPLNCSRFIDWPRISAVFINAKRTDMECQMIWELYLHPSINKKPWTTSENNKLKAIVQKHKSQNWKQIVLELDTNRSELIVCRHYFNILTDKFKKGFFTHKEDMKLLDIVNEQKIGSYIPWSKIAKHFGNRTRSQLHHRYTYYLSEHLKMKGRFSKAEDILLMICVDKFGKNFKKCSTYLPGRSMVQCKARYANSLVRTYLKANWTAEEDKIIFEYVKEHGNNSWTQLSKKMSRTRGQVRQRYQRIQHYLETTPNANIENVPKRFVKSNSSETVENDYAFRRSIADKYLDKEKIPTLDEIRAMLKVANVVDDGNCSDNKEDNKEKKTESKRFKEDNITSSKSPKDNIDELLVDFFYGSYVLPKIKVVDPVQFEKAVDDIESVLNILKVDLNIPDHITIDHHLDAFDVKILHSLSSRNSLESKKFTAAEKTIAIRNFIPPTIHSLVALRCLLIRHLNLKDKRLFILSSDFRNPFSVLKQYVANDILNCNTDDIRETEIERNLFYQRFYALFKWPALITLHNPTPELMNFCSTLPARKQIQAKRTYSRANINSSAANSKKFKANETAGVLKLRPVTNMSVIKDLMADKTKKLYSLNSVNENGQVKTVINEVKLDFSNEKVVFNDFSCSTTPPGVEIDAGRKAVGNSITPNRFETEIGGNLNAHSYFMPSLTESDMQLDHNEIADALDKDLQDLQKMNEFIKAEFESGESTDSDNEIDVI